MPPDRTCAGREPAHGTDAGGAGSVVVGIDPATLAGVALFKVRPAPEALAERVNALAVVFQQFRENLARAGEATERAAYETGRALQGMSAPARMPDYGVGDAMVWSPPPDGEETPLCPA